MPSRLAALIAAFWLGLALPVAAQPKAPEGAGAPPPTPAKPFEPSEKIPPGTPVPFPVDI